MKRFPQLAALSLALLALALPRLATAAERIPDDCRVGGFVVGVQSFTFNRFSVMEAIEKAEQAGCKTIEFYPKQKLSADEPKVFFNHDSSDEVIQRVKEKLEKHHIKMINYGVVDIPKDEAGARKVFDFAKKMGLYGITTESTNSLDTMEKLVKEYDIKVGFHAHAKRPNYEIWDPHFLANLLKDRDPRIGICADTGHWQTSGLDALQCIKDVSGRIISLHLKDRAALGPGNHDQIFGTGISKIAETLAELRKQGFDGNISLEYEYNWDNSVPDIAQCVGFIRGWAAANPK